MILRSIFAAALLAPSAFSTPSLTTIQDVLYKADGTRFSGTLLIRWRSFEASDSSAIAMQSITTQVINGALRVQLVPTANSVPAATYIVTYNSTGKIQFQEAWSVPQSSTPVRVRDVRIGTSMGTIGVAGAGIAGLVTGPIEESDVNGLVVDLGARPVKGPGFAAGRAAVV